MSVMPLDVARLRKVRDLHARAATPGERAAAADRMTVLAERAGMTVEAALSKLDATAPPSRPTAMATAFRDFLDTPEMSAQFAERERQRAERRIAALAVQGTEEAVFDEGPWEHRLRLACEPLIEPRPIHGGDMDTLAGWTLYQRDMPAAVREAVSSAYRLPRTVLEAWHECQAWEEIGDDRAAFWRDYQHPLWVGARVVVVEGLLDTLPAAGAGDVTARLAWMCSLAEMGFPRSAAETTALIGRLSTGVAGMAGVVTALAALVERLARDAGAEPVQNGHPPPPQGGGRSAAPVHSGHPRRSTRAERYAAIRMLLANGLTDREIARRLEVSPTTVGSVRRAMAQGHHPAP